MIDPYNVPKMVVEFSGYAQKLLQELSADSHRTTLEECDVVAIAILAIRHCEARFVANHCKHKWKCEHEETADETLRAYLAAAHQEGKETSQ